MTPKEKAKELIEKYYDIQHEFDETTMYYWDIAKQCALIAVDEVIKEVPEEYLDSYKGRTYYAINERFEYWKEVKTEIEIL